MAEEAIKEEIKNETNDKVQAKEETPAVKTDDKAMETPKTEGAEAEKTADDTKPSEEKSEEVKADAKAEEKPAETPTEAKPEEKPADPAANPTAVAEEKKEEGEKVVEEAKATGTDEPSNPAETTPDEVLKDVEKVEYYTIKINKIVLIIIVVLLVILAGSFATAKYYLKLI